MSERALCVIGLGLMGGSLLRAADRAGWQVQGTATSTADVTAAREAGFDVTTAVAETLRAAGACDALVVLAVPLPAVTDVLAVLAQQAPHCRLTDVVGVKHPVADAVARYAPLARYVGGHPMAGTARSGWAAGSAELFTGAAWVVGADEGTEIEVWAQVAGLALDCGAHVVPAAAADHDAAVARVSHLPHLLAAVLAAVGAGGGPLAMALGAGSFTDGTRVAGSPPDLVRAMCEGNRTALLDAVDDALGRLGAARGSLASTGSLQATIRAGHLARRAFDAARSRAQDGHRVQIDLAGTAALERLREIGRSGGRVTALHGTVCTCITPT
ncbi:MAG TPA: prephenate dehydrogenase [Pseudonocardiaceae bacterium]|jgi:prephenate dehydrogenase|nr:prephenate dehydrogenase [Pseudonocardiaceae bacterium]